MKENEALRQKTISVNFAGTNYKIAGIKSEKEMMAQAHQAALGHKSKLGSLKTNSALDYLVSQLDNQGKNINAYEKTKMDWDKYTKEQKMENELEKNRKDGFLGK